MCMTKVTANLDSDYGDGVGIGYKVFLECTNHGHKRLKFLNMINYEFINIGKWMNASKLDKDYVSKYGRIVRNKIQTGFYDPNAGKYNYQFYTPGFHIFTNKEDAKAYNKYGELRKVLYKNVTSVGLQGTAVCIIAQDMKVLPKDE